MAIIREIQGDLFTCDEKYYLAHCISSDGKLGKGIAKEFNIKFKGMRQQIIEIGRENIQPPSVVKIGKVFNLVTKRWYYDKPTYESFEATLQLLAKQINDEGILYLAIPRLGCGLDKLTWVRVKRIIEKTFKDNEELNIDIYYL